MVKFDVVFNALDNIEARRHVNRVCVAAERPLVDGAAAVRRPSHCPCQRSAGAGRRTLRLLRAVPAGGTQGYDGQVTTIVKGKTECYDCEPKPAPKGYPVCTIRTTPDKPIHCIVWGKHLFALLFGTKDDANEVATIDPAWSGEELLRQLYVAEIEKLAENEKLWSERRPPAPLDVDTLAAASSSRRSCRAARKVLLQDDQVPPPPPPPPYCCPYPCPYCTLPPSPPPSGLGPRGVCRVLPHELCGAADALAARRRGV